jgi:transposase-like protein
VTFKPLRQVSLERVKTPGKRDKAGRWRCGDCNRVCTVYDLFGIVFADCKAGHYDVVDLGESPRVESIPQVSPVQPGLPGLS